MPAVYPGGIKTFVVRVDGVGNIIFAAHVNDLQDEVNAVETGLINGFQHAIRPDSTANARDIGLSTARFRTAYLGTSLDVSQGAVTASTPIFNLLSTWNNAAVTFTALLLNVTDTASAAASLLLALQNTSVTKFSVDKSGNLFVSGAVGMGTPADTTKGALVIQGGALAVTASILQMLATWNSGATVFPGALLVNVTDTASAVGSLLADFQVSGVSKAKVDKAGNLTLVGTITASNFVVPTVTFKKGTQSGVDYTTTLATYVDVDATNLGLTVTIPVGQKLSVIAAVPASAPAGGQYLRLVDGTTAIAESILSGSWGGPAILKAVVVGDGAAHTIKLQYASVTGGQTATIFNRAASTTTTPANGFATMRFRLEVAN